MAPPKKPPQTAEAASASGNKLLTDYFKRPRAGRPKKSGNVPTDQIEPARKKKRGPVPKAKPKPQAKSKRVAQSTAPQKKQEPDVEPKKKKTRTNWGSGEPLKR